MSLSVIFKVAETHIFASTSCELILWLVIQEHHPYFLWVVGMGGWARWGSVVFSFIVFLLLFLVLFLHACFPSWFFYPQLSRFLYSVYLPDTPDTLTLCYKCILIPRKGWTLFMKSIRSDTSSGDVIGSFRKAIIWLQDQDSEMVEKEEPGYGREMRNSDCAGEMSIAPKDKTLLTLQIYQELV